MSRSEPPIGRKLELCNLSVRVADRTHCGIHGCCSLAALWRDPGIRRLCRRVWGCRTAAHGAGRHPHRVPSTGTIHPTLTSHHRCCSGTLQQARRLRRVLRTCAGSSCRAPFCSHTDVDNGSSVCFLLVQIYETFISVLVPALFSCARQTLPVHATLHPWLH